MNKKVLQIFIHVTAWVGFLTLPTLTTPTGSVDQHPAVTQLINAVLLGNILLICIFYLNYFIITPHYLAGNYFKFLLYSTIAASVFFITDYFLRPSPDVFMPQLPSPPNGLDVPPPMFFHFISVIMFLIAYFVSFGLRVSSQWKIAQEEKLQAELSYLKAQINPHFLFNTLNNIYSLTLIKSNEAPSAVLKLSSMMRYSINEAQQNYITLQKEIDYITNYIDLQKMRLANGISITYHVTGQAEGKVISPFMLIPFIENAFKHGVNTASDTLISINIDITESLIILQVSNKKVIIKSDHETSGIGIQNTRRRLNYFYPSRHTLTVSETADHFNVTLNIQIA